MFQPFSTYFQWNGQVHITEIKIVCICFLKEILENFCIKETNENTSNFWREIFPRPIGNQQSTPVFLVHKRRHKRKKSQTTPRWTFRICATKLSFRLKDLKQFSSGHSNRPGQTCFVLMCRSRAPIPENPPEYSQRSHPHLNAFELLRLDL